MIASRLLLDVALDLKKAGEAQAALEVLARAAAAPISGAGNQRPLAHYVTASILEDLGHSDAAALHREQARSANRTWAFPVGLDALDALQQSITADPGDAVAHSLLGMLLYAHGRRHEASTAWRQAIQLGLQDPVLLRNSALAAYNIDHDDQAAWSRYSQAITLAPEDPRLRYEQDQLAIRLGHSAAERLERLAPVEELVLERDDFTIEYVRLLAAQGRAERAYQILTSRNFHPWEGGEGQAIAAWDATISALGRDTEDPPASLGEVRAHYVAPKAVREDGVTDYFATSHPELLLFSREYDQA